MHCKCYIYKLLGFGADRNVGETRGMQIVVLYLFKKFFLNRKK